jgi:hypothetical protein
MGSFAASVDLAERLRPFAFAGLELVFLPEGLCALPQACAEETSYQEQAATAPCEAPEYENSDLAPSMWPEPWSLLHARVRTPPRVIITYASLADDIAATADPSRRKLFHSVLAFLGWPTGTTLFWPISFPTGADPAGLFAADIFAAGVRHYDIKHIVCFGEQPSTRALTLYPQEGKAPAVVVHTVPEPDSLVSLRPHQLQQALAALKSIQLS